MRHAEFDVYMKLFFQRLHAATTVAASICLRSIYY